MRFPIEHNGAQIASGAPSFTGTYLKPGVLTFREIASPHPIPFRIGDSVYYTRTGLHYYLFKIPQVKKQARPGSHGASYLYQGVEFHDATYEFEICPFRDLVYSDNLVHFSTQSAISVFDNVAGIAERVQACLDAFHPGAWVVRLATAEMGAPAELLALMAEEREFVVSGVTLLGILDKIYEIWPEVGWVFTEENGKNVVTIGGAGLNGSGDSYIYGKGKGLTSLTKTDADSSQIANRLYVYGSQRNVIANWYNHQNIHGAESVDIQNLMLPAGQVSGDAVKFVYNGKIYTYSGRIYTYPSKVALYPGWGLTDGLPDPAKAYIEDAASILARGLREKAVYFDGTGDLKEIYPTLERVTMAEVRNSGPEYVPASTWADSERVDEILSCNNPSDDGLAGTNGKNSLQRFNDDFANSASGTAPGNKETTVRIYTKQITATVSGELKVKADVKINGWLTCASNQYIAARFTILKWVGNYTEGAILAQHEQAAEYSYDDYAYRVKSGVVETDKIQVASGDRFIVAVDLVFSVAGDTGLQYTYSDDGYLDFTIGTYREKTFFLNLKQIGFDISEQAALGEGMTLAMRTGMCAGREFKIKSTQYLQSSDTWRLEVIRSEDESLAQWFPNSTYQINAGDHFVLLDIAMPAMYISIAERRLLAAAQELLADTAREQWQYTPEIDAKFMIENGRTIMPAQNITLVDDIVPSGAVSVLVDSVTISEGDAEIPTYKVTLRDRKKKSYSDKASVTPISSRPVTDVEDTASESSSSGSSSGGGTGHTHANKATLDKLGLDGLYLTSEGNKIQAGYADTAGSAGHATTADSATEAGHAETADRATEASHADDADHADNADLAERALTADYAADSDKWDGAQFGDYMNQPVRTTDNVDFNKVTTPEVVSSDIHSADFTTGPLGAGFRLYKPAGGNSSLELDEITVRKTMKVFELIIQQIQHQGGIVIFSAASIECNRVVELETGYKCYFDTKTNEQGVAQVPNLFAVGDQARCQRFALASTVAKYYWRLVTEVGADYIILSKTDCDTGSGIPEVGDNIIQLGNRLQTARQNAEVITTTDGNSPRTDYYKGINSYDLTGKLITTVGVKDGEVGVWTKNGSFEGVVTITGGSGLSNLDEWNDLSQSIIDAQTAADKALSLLADINDDNVLDLSEKNTIRTEWITINGVESTARSSAKGSYAQTRALFEKYATQIGRTVYVNNGTKYTYNGISYTYRAVGIAGLDSAYLALREFLASVELNRRDEVFRGFDRAKFSELLTAYYDAEIKVSDAVNSALQTEIATAKAETMAALSAYETAMNATVAEMKDVIDNTIETWFAAGTPTNSNAPAVNWNTDALKKQHLGDLYYDNGEGSTAGFAFRWERTGTEGNYVYGWNQLNDSAIAKALAAANRAYDLADGKRRTFLSQPGTNDAYDEGDMWLHATLNNTHGNFVNETLVASHGKAAGVAFVADDWVRASKYTDDTVANQALADAAQAQSDADAAALAASSAQSKADSAYGIATAARDRLATWADDGYISPQEKTALRQQRADIEAEYAQIIADAALYPSVSDTAYVTAYNAICGANGVFDKYTAATPENIPVVAAELALIDTYYDERTDILNAIASAARDKANAAQSAADAAQAAADAAQADATQALADAAAAQSTANQAVSDAAAAQSTANSAQSDANAANSKLTTWASDAYISPNEKTALAQQQKDIQTEKDDIVLQAEKYEIDTANYLAAYANANAALAYYTASTPESIAILHTGQYQYEYIAAYYDARLTILSAIANAAKAYADAVTALAEQNAAAIAQINDDTVLDASEKAVIRTLWIGINGISSTVALGYGGTYYAAKRMLEEYAAASVPVKYVFNGKVYTFNGFVFTYNKVGGAYLDACYTALRDYLNAVGLNDDAPFEGFSRITYSELVRNYDVALNNVQKTLTDVAKGIAEDATGQLNEWGADGAISPMEKRGLAQIKADIVNEWNTLITKADDYGVVYSDFTPYYNRAIASLNKYTADLTTTSARDADYEYIAAYYPQRDILKQRIDIAEKELIDAKAAANDVEYLTNALAKDNTVITGGVVLSSFIGVKDSLNAVKAAINASSDVAGFNDATHGRLMIAAGISVLSTAKDTAATRIFEDGTIMTNKIHATEGTIGSMMLNENGLLVKDGATYISFFGGNSSFATTTDGFLVISAGINSTSPTATDFNAAPFRVYSNGAMFATVGSIGGFTIGSDFLGTRITSRAQAFAFHEGASLYNDLFIIGGTNTAVESSPTFHVALGRVNYTSDELVSIIARGDLNDASEDELNGIAIDMRGGNPDNHAIRIGNGNIYGLRPAVYVNASTLALNVVSSSYFTQIFNNSATKSVAMPRNRQGSYRLSNGHTFLVFHTTANPLEFWLQQTDGHPFYNVRTSAVSWSFESTTKQAIMFVYSSDYTVSYNGVVYTGIWLAYTF